jgi:putative copper resistance protein D
VALATYAGVIVITHLTGLMGTIMQHPWAGQVEHLAYLITGFQFFTLVFGAEPIRWRLSVPGRLVLLAMSMAVDTFVGLVLLQSSQPIAMLGHPGWGPSALADTQAGGAIMWAGGDGLMAVLAISLFVSWAQRPDQLGLESSWFEQARRSLQAERQAGAVAPQAGVAAVEAPVPTGDLDEDEEQWRSYNAWLKALQDGSARP